MKRLYLLLFVLVIVSCSNDKHQLKTRTDTVTIIERDTISENGSINQNQKVQSNATQNLVGHWKEHWGIGVETNVNTNDIYQIEQTKDGNINITSSNKNKYKIDKILFDGHELSFRKQNRLYPLGRFYVYYKLKLHDDLNWMEGPITNNKKQKDYVKWERVNLNK